MCRILPKDKWQTHTKNPKDSSREPANFPSLFIDVLKYLYPTFSKVLMTVLNATV